VNLNRRAVTLGLLGSGLARAQTRPPAQELVVASYPSLDEGVKVGGPLYAKRVPDARIKLASLSYGDHHNAMVTSLATGTSLPDAVGIEVTYLGRLIESGALEDLSQPPYNALQYRDRIVPYTFAQASRRDGTLVAMPVDIGPGTLLYRHDLVTKAGVLEAQLSESWESFIAAGKQIKARTGALLLPNAQSLADVFVRSNVKSGDGIYFDANDMPLINTPRFERAFQLALAAREAGLDGKFQPWTIEWNEGFRRGTFVAEMSGAWLAGHLARYMAPQTAGLWRAAQLPAGAFASWGGSFYGIPKALSPERKLAAWRFIEFLATDSEMQLLALRQLDAYPALLAAARDPYLDQPIDFLGGQRARQLWRAASTNIPALTVNKLDPIAKEVVTGELDRVLEGGKRIPAALRDAQRKVTRRVRR
jgi:multiple sugar transport system substrate-binding protein